MFFAASFEAVAARLALALCTLALTLCTAFSGWSLTAALVLSTPWRVVSAVALPVATATGYALLFDSQAP